MAPTHDFFLRLFYTSPMYVVTKFICLDMPGTLKIQMVIFFYKFLDILPVVSVFLGWLEVISAMIKDV